MEPASGGQNLATPLNNDTGERPQCDRHRQRGGIAGARDGGGDHDDDHDGKGGTDDDSENVEQGRCGVGRSRGRDTNMFSPSFGKAVV